MDRTRIAVLERSVEMLILKFVGYNKKIVPDCTPEKKESEQEPEQAASHR